MKPIKPVLFSLVLLGFALIVFPMPIRADPYENNDTYGTSSWIPANSTTPISAFYDYQFLDCDDPDYYSFTIEPSDNITVTWYSYVEDPIWLNFTLYDESATIVNSTAAYVLNGSGPGFTSELSYNFTSLNATANATLLFDHGFLGIRYTFTIRIERVYSGSIPAFGGIALLVAILSGIGVTFVIFRKKVQAG
ncbi:hypothetical protein GF325_06035 [Candidatus Bathyarchaeota archaeon]|nr:hypothetical protein [Candidatus Bathyarchaeota archaeon]